MATTSTRLGLHAPSGGDPADAPADFTRLRDQLDAKVAVFDRGPLASRPAAGVTGRIYEESVTRDIYWDTGTGWLLIGGEPEAARIVGAVGQPAFENGYGASPGLPPRFWRHGTRVYLGGVVVPTGATDQRTIWTLPAGYRPPYQLYLLAYLASASTPQRVVIETTGAIHMASGSGVGIYLDGLSFDTVRG